jgi:hypothetical protein
MDGLHLEYGHTGASTGLTAMKIKAGKYYVNGRKDLLGPMDERTPGVFLDQFGRLYHPDGRQWDHVEGSTGNIVAEAAP